MSYETLIFYSVVTSVITLDRVNLKKRVVDAPEILTVIDSIPNLTPFLNSLYGCQYGSFFKASHAPCLTAVHAYGQTCSVLHTKACLTLLHSCLQGHGPASQVQHHLAQHCYTAPECVLLIVGIMPVPLSKHSHSVFPKECFFVSAQAFSEIINQVDADPYLHPHLRYYVREVRVVAYSQVCCSLSCCLALQGQLTVVARAH